MYKGLVTNCGCQSKWGCILLLEHYRWLQVIVFFSKSYIFSILLCVFYSVLNEAGTFVMGTLPKAAVYLMPVPLTTLWSAADMQQNMAFGDTNDLIAFADLIPSEFTVISILSALAAISMIIMAQLYKRRGQ